MTMGPETPFDGSEFHLPNHEEAERAKWNFANLKTRVGEIYEQHDLENGYTADTMAVKMLSNAFTLKRITERDPENIERMKRSLGNVVIWATTFANYGHQDLLSPLLEKYALGCPRCHQMPCNLAEGSPCVKIGENEPYPNPPFYIPFTIDEWQEHLATLYPNNYFGAQQDNIRNAASRLQDEVVEIVASTDPDPNVQEEDERLSHHDISSKTLEPWKGELADIFAWSFAVAEAISRKTGGFSLEKYLRENYEKGCPYCKSSQCQCRKDTTLLELAHTWEPP